MLTFRSSYFKSIFFLIISMEYIWTWLLHRCYDIYYLSLTKIYCYYRTDASSWRSWSLVGADTRCMLTSPSLSWAPLRPTLQQAFSCSQCCWHWQHCCHLAWGLMSVPYSMRSCVINSKISTALQLSSFSKLFYKYVMHCKKSSCEQFTNHTMECITIDILIRSMSKFFIMSVIPNTAKISSGSPEDIAACMFCKGRCSLLDSLVFSVVSRQENYHRTRQEIQACENKCAWVIRK